MKALYLKENFSPFKSNLLKLSIYYSKMIKDFSIYFTKDL